MGRAKGSEPGIAGLPTWQGRLATVVIETPKNTPNKLKFDPDLGVMRLSRVLPAGKVFPFDFGFMAGTLAPDGDPLDVLVLMDSPVPAGCVVLARLIGVLQCEQADKGRRLTRNDRVIAVAAESMTHSATRSIRDVSSNLLEEIEAFFEDYNRFEGRRFRVIRRAGRETARRLARAAQASAEERRGPMGIR
jgi:inorganic pyrophosphatase